jgi:glycosyltransferase involved in cell wall biosynthesis
MPYISIIVAVYNTEKYIEKCLISILKQTYRDYEIILVDDGSTDQSGYICDQYAQKDNRIRVIHKRNGGPNSSRKAGIKNAEGEFVSFVDSDDWVESDMYEKLYGVAVSDNTIDICIGTYLCEDENAEVTYPFEKGPEGLIAGEEALYEMFTRKYFNWSLCDKIYRRSLFEDVSFWDKANSYGEDTVANWDLFRRARKIYYKPVAGYHYVNNSESMIHRSFSDDKLIYIDIYCGILEECPSNTRLYEAVRKLLLLSCEDNMCRLIDEAVNGREEFNKYRKLTRKYLCETNEEKENIRHKLILMSYEDAKDRISTINDKIVTECSRFCSKRKNVYIYGAGHIAGNVLSLIENKTDNIVGIVVSHKALNNTEYMGKRIYSICELTEKSSDDKPGIIVAMNHKNCNEVEGYLRDHAFSYINVGKDSIWYS